MWSIRSYIQSDTILTEILYFRLLLILTFPHPSLHESPELPASPRSFLPTMSNGRIPGEVGPRSYIISQVAVPPPHIRNVGQERPSLGRLADETHTGKVCGGKESRGKTNVAPRHQEVDTRFEERTGSGIRGGWPGSIWMRNSVSIRSRAMKAFKSHGGRLWSVSEDTQFPRGRAWRLSPRGGTGNGTVGAGLGCSLGSYSS
jgi:hypothetical protein